MTLEGTRRICRSWPGVTEDIKWGQDLCFSVGGKMFAAMNTEPPYSIGFKCAPETFAELTERDGINPAPYLARAGWVQEEELGTALEDREFERFLRASYDLVVAKLPRSRRPRVAVSDAAGQPSAGPSVGDRRRPRRPATARTTPRAKPER